MNDEPDPLQAYGRQKRDGEIAVLAEQEKGAAAVVLRVPILYGKTEYNGESAVNILRDGTPGLVSELTQVVEDQSGKKYNMDHYQVRFPTNVEDVARVLYDLSREWANIPVETTRRSDYERQLTRDLDRSLPGILHYSSPAPAMTKYDMTKVIAKHLNLPLDHVTPDADKPIVKPGQTERPENTQLGTDSLVELGIDTREDLTFDEYWGKLTAKNK